MKRKIAFLVATLISTVYGAAAQIPSARDVVKPASLASFDPIGRGQQLDIAVVMKIKDGFHVNARETTFDYLIPTDLKAEPIEGFKLGAVKYPKGTLHKFSFAKDQALNVYTDTVVLFVPVAVDASAPLGEQHLALKLRYQACNNEVCLPPVTLPVDAVIRVSSRESRPSHPELFGKP
jgi:thioredoxin:protein disulfide reductase